MSVTDDKSTLPAVTKAKPARGRRRTRPTRVYHCSTCFEPGHTSPRCRFAGLSLWTNGLEIVIAKSPEHAAALWNDPISDEFSDLWSTAEEWGPVAAEALEITAGGAPVRWTQRKWITLNREGILANAEGALEPGRRWE